MEASGRSKLQRSPPTPIAPELPGIVSSSGLHSCTAWVFVICAVQLFKRASSLIVATLDARLDDPSSASESPANSETTECAVTSPIAA